MNSRRVGLLLISSIVIVILAAWLSSNRTSTPVTALPVWSTVMPKLASAIGPVPLLITSDDVAASFTRK